MFCLWKTKHFANDCLENEYCEPNSDEECEVWCCSYCGKEFDTYKGATFHENVHCKKNKCSYYEEYDEESDENYDNDFQINKKSSNCYRCGRKIITLLIAMLQNILKVHRCKITFQVRNTKY